MHAVKYYVLKGNFALLILCAKYIKVKRFKKNGGRQAVIGRRV